MIDLLLSIIFSVLLLINFRLHPRFGVNTFQTIILNYPVCIITGLLFLPENQHFSLDLSETSTLLAMLLGVGFVITFMLSGISTQRIGMAMTSLANNMSLVVPVIFSLVVLKMSSSFDTLNYLGLILAIVAVVLSTFKKSESDSSNKKENIDWLLPIAVFVMYGITNTTFNYLNAKYVTASGTTIPFTLTILVGSVLIGGIVLGIRIMQGKEKLVLKSLVAAVPLGIPNFLSFYYLLKALDAYQNNGAFVLPIYNIGVIVGSALVAFIFFQEKFTLLNKIGLILAVMAIGLISYQGLF
ncbi:drug/metabolite transporter (DMT)-like permease [Arcicella rosea]|uniref:EamA/RhaT family transporter n=1 Tax=Arcicella rosea TaxID=502909 RepID=UPI00345DADDC